MQRSHVIKRRLLAAGMTGWQLAELLGVHEHQIDLEELPTCPSASCSNSPAASTCTPPT
ncbi:hypothetical protein [Streptomyces sp. NBC_00045]|uniref:hypothetical protein n=1 Tax=Streptomyces sp. NBC_00045 TaxID=2975625 RepID=UPI00325416F8